MFKSADYAPADRRAAISLRARLISDASFAQQLLAGGVAAAEANEILSKISRAMLGSPENFTPGALSADEMEIT